VLAGLHERLQPEPCQTMEFASAPSVELVLEPHVASEAKAEPHFRDSIQLHLTRPIFSRVCPRMGPTATDGAERRRLTAGGRGGAKQRREAHRRAVGRRRRDAAVGIGEIEGRREKERVA
jgi:hypothetical protein